MKRKIREAAVYHPENQHLKRLLTMPQTSRKAGRNQFIQLYIHLFLFEKQRNYKTIVQKGFNVLILFQFFNSADNNE